MKIHISKCHKRNKDHYTNFMADALRALGHEVYEFDSVDYSPLFLRADRLINRSPFVLFSKKYPERFDFKRKYKKFIGEKWLATVEEFGPDMLIVINTGDVSCEAIKIARGKFKIKKMISWVVDNPGSRSADDMLNFLPYFDKVFTTDPGWLPIIKFFNQNASYLPLASSDSCYKFENRKRDLDFSFVGSFFPNEPTGFLRAYLFSKLPASARVEIYGPQIDFFKNIYPELRNFTCFNRNVSFKELNEIWNRSKLTATIYDSQVVEGSAPRVFDAALTKTPQLIQSTKTIQDLFPGIKLALFSSSQEFSEKADYYLNHSKEADELAQAMYEYAKKNHQFTNRAKELIEKSF